MQSAESQPVSRQYLPTAYCLLPTNDMAFEPILTTHCADRDGYTLDSYMKNQRGYEGRRKALTLKPSDIIEQVKESGLRGRGGAVPTPSPAR